MAEIVRMLALSPTMEEGHLVSWAKSEGDAVDEGDIIAEVETDKAAMDMESFFEGTLLKILAPAGSSLKVGTAMAIIGEPGEDISALLGDSALPAAEAPAPVAAAAPAPAATPAPATVATPAPAPVATPTAAPAAAGADRQFSSPVARKIAAEHGVDIAAVAGSGPAGRVVKRDVEAAVAAVTTAAAATPAVAEGGERINLTPMRKAIARRMTESWTTAPLFALQMEIDMGPAMTLRKQLNTSLAAADAGLKISVNDMIIKACGLALREVPAMNVGWGGDHIVQFDGVHIGVAVAIDGGLITPVVRDADTLTLGAITRNVRDLAGRARKKKLKPHEYTGSTFSISNLGMYGISRFQAVLNPPEAGILAVGAVQQRPVVQDGAIAVGMRMDVTLSVDHRSSDGAVGSVFLQALKRLLENPVLLTV
jgi:pyruvate dehydrogenase E2 component (dihydrolipoamide acetyltransferase)